MEICAIFYFTTYFFSRRLHVTLPDKRVPMYARQALSWAILNSLSTSIPYVARVTDGLWLPILIDDEGGGIKQ